jgi:hypothetical protein
LASIVEELLSETTVSGSFAVWAAGIWQRWKLWLRPWSSAGVLILGALKMSMWSSGPSGPSGPSRWCFAIFYGEGFWFGTSTWYCIVKQSCKVESWISVHIDDRPPSLQVHYRDRFGSNNAILTKLTMIIPCKQKDPKESSLRHWESPASKFKYVETYLKPFSIMIRYYRKGLWFTRTGNYYLLSTYMWGDISHKIPDQLTRLTWDTKSSSQNNLRRRRFRALRLRKISPTSMTSWLRQILYLNIFRW